jgi:hypothetical protein
VNKSLHEKIEVIESGYEFMLAYAAQGRETDRGLEVRQTLENMSVAAAAIVRELDDGDFAAVVADDARKSRAAIGFVLAQKDISSELVDNLNVSIHLRALVTDLFLLSEAKSCSEAVFPDGDFSKWSVPPVDPLPCTRPAWPSA